MGQLLFHFWPYILISSISAIIFVLLNSISIWLTASFINNVLTDFDKIVQSQSEWACLLYTSPSKRDATLSRMAASA